MVGVTDLEGSGLAWCGHHLYAGHVCQGKRVYQALGALLLGPGAGEANSVVRPPFRSSTVFAWC
jgi:hypothetical protein